MGGLIDRVAPLGTAVWRMGRPPPRVVFLHIPKCGGTSVARFFYHRLGHPKYGGSVVLGANPSEAALRQARRAKFVTGHFGWDVLEAVRGDAFAFTVLRDPFARIWSEYRFARFLKPGKKHHALGERRIGNMSFEEFCTSSDPDILSCTDNVMTRMLGASQAARNLERLDVVLFVDSLDEGMRSIAKRLGLPPPISRRRHNEGLGGAALNADREIARPRVNLDYLLYRRAMQLFDPRCHNDHISQASVHLH